MRVYHFLNPNYGISNLSLKRLKISRFNQLNDPFELLGADLLNPNHRKEFKEFKKHLSESKGMICFSKSWSNPLIWGHYADCHRGMSLGFDIPDELLVQVKYTPQRPRMEFDKKTNKLIDRVDVENKLIRTKFIDWHYEEEYRYLTDLNSISDHLGNYFVDFSSEIKLRKVVLGMNCDIPISRVRRLLENDLNPSWVIKAGMAHRSFKIIEDRSFRLSK